MIRLSGGLVEAAKKAAATLCEDRTASERFVYAEAHYAVTQSSPRDTIGRYYGRVKVDDTCTVFLFLLNNGDRQ